MDLKEISINFNSNLIERYRFEDGLTIPLVMKLKKKLENPLFVEESSLFYMRLLGQLQAQLNDHINK